MSYSPILLVHISAATIGLLSGTGAMAFRKGSRLHGLAGNVFVVSMLTMSSAGAYLAFRKSEMGNVFGGVLTFYLVATAWLTARRRDGETRMSDWVALLGALTIAGTVLSFGIEAARSLTGTKDGVPAGAFFYMSSVVLLAATGDARMLWRGGLYGAHRIARHLWRMSFAFFVATASLFLARPHLFPAVLIRTHVLFVLGILPLILMVFWMIRIRFKNPYTGTAAHAQRVGDRTVFRNHPSFESTTLVRSSASPTNASPPSASPTIASPTIAAQTR